MHLAGCEQAEFGQTGDTPTPNVTASTARLDIEEFLTHWQINACRNMSHLLTSNHMAFLSRIVERLVGVQEALTH